MNCHKCQAVIHNKSIFCTHCGAQQDMRKKVDFNKHVKQISFFFFLLLAYLLCLSLIPYDYSYYYDLAIDISFAAIIMVFFFKNFKIQKKLFRIHRLNSFIITLVFVGAVVYAFLMNILGQALNQGLFDTYTIPYYELYSDTAYPLLFSIISVGFFPAVFEEIAFRGIIFNELLKITRLKSTIYISAFLFTILHLNLLSIIFILPFGLVAGYLRAKYNTLWYGIIAHFIYNSCIVIFEILVFPL